MNADALPEEVSTKTAALSRMVVNECLLQCGKKLRSRLYRHILEKELSNLFTGVPIREVELHPEALPKEGQDLFLCHAALLCDQPQHLRHAVLVESIIFFPFDQLLKNLEV